MFILKKDNEYYVGGWLVWSRFDIRAVIFPTLEDAEKTKSQFCNPKIEIKKWRNV